MPLARECDTETLIDVALGKAAQQSSISEFSLEDDAANPISGRTFPDFAFHTQEEDRPWWRVDLGAIYPIEAIVVHNRVTMLQERAARLRVEIAESEDDWTLIHAGFIGFGSRQNGAPLTLPIASQLRARFVRLSLDERNILHLAKVEVLARADMLALNRFCARTDLPYHAPAWGAPYKIAQHPDNRYQEIVGVCINHSGRFGNLLIQYINVIQLAERTGLKFIKLGWHDLFDPPREFEAGGVRFIPARAPLPPVGLFLAGEFFRTDPLVPVLNPFLRYGEAEEADTSRICQTYLLPHIITGLPAPGERKFDDELTLHFRSGDVFGSDHPDTLGYRQPPLSFYQLVVGRMLSAERGVRRVRLVFEDRGNPCVDAVEHWLGENQIPCRTQSASLRDDLSALVDARHLVLGHGTFGYAAVRLSQRIETVHFFAPQLGGSYQHMPNVGEVYEVSDSGDYIRAYEYDIPLKAEESWSRTPENYRRMLDYPVDKLSLRRVK